MSHGDKTNNYKNKTMAIENSIFDAHRKKEKVRKHISQINDTMPISNEIFERYRIEHSLKKKSEMIVGAKKILLQEGYGIKDQLDNRYIKDDETI